MERQRASQIMFARSPTVGLHLQLHGPILGHDLNDLDIMNRLSSAIDNSDNVDNVCNKFAILPTHILGANRNINKSNIDHMNAHGALGDTAVENNHGSSYNGPIFSGHRSDRSIVDVPVEVSPADLQNGSNQIHGLSLFSDEPMIETMRTKKC